MHGRSSRIATAKRGSSMKMRRWRREMAWEDTRLPWIPPSPNVPSPTSALAITSRISAHGVVTVSERMSTTAPASLPEATEVDDAASVLLISRREPAAEAALLQERTPPPLPPTAPRRPTTPPRAAGPPRPTAKQRVVRSRMVAAELVQALVASERATLLGVRSEASRGF